MIEININFAGSTYNIYNTYVTNNFIINGTGTLTSNYTIAFLGTPQTGNTITFYYKGVVDKASYNFNILGTNLTSTQLNRESTITAVYNGVSWDLNVGINTQSASWLKPTDQATGGNYDVITAPVSFESGEQGNAKIYLPYACTIKAVIFTATKALAGTDDGNVSMDDNGGTTVFSLTVPMSTTLGTSVQNSSVNYSYTPPSGITSYVTLRQSKITAGGKGTVAIITERT